MRDTHSFVIDARLHLGQLWVVSVKLDRFFRRSGVRVVLGCSALQDSGITCCLGASQLKFRRRG